MCQWSSTEKLCHNDFKATDGWLAQWKCRFGIKFRKADGEKDSADTGNSRKLPNLLQKFCADDIYNADGIATIMHLSLVQRKQYVK
jgi:hypothetical protein